MTPSEKKPGSIRLAASAPGALTAVLLVGAVAFGATGLRSSQTADPTPKPAVQAAFVHDSHPKTTNEHKASEEPMPTTAPKATATPTKPAKQAKETKEPKATATPTKEPEAKKPTPAPTAKPQPASTKKPAPTQKPKPVPTTPVALALEGWAKETKAKLAWKPYTGDGFEYYKVVRSADATVTWPTTGGDELVGVISDRNAPWLADRPSCGKAWSYRVFAVRHGDAGYVTLGASNVVSVTVACAPAPTPAPEPPVVLPLAFQAAVSPGVGIGLGWQACAADGFTYYKVVRSQVNADPRFPLNDGTELIAVIGDAAQTQFVDTDVTAGETWHYRVVAVSKRDGSYLPICQTAVAAATAG